MTLLGSVAFAFFWPDQGDFEQLSNVSTIGNLTKIVQTSQMLGVCSGGMGTTGIDLCILLSILLPKKMCDVAFINLVTNSYYTQGQVYI